MAYKIYIEPQGKAYPYQSPRKEESGSLPENPEVTTKMKPIDRDKANSEVEKGEIILDPTTGALHKALGKPHNKGGTPVSLKDGSFIFSNYSPLAIKKTEKEIFEFKMGGKYKPANNTPSKVLEKEVDIKHHNKMIDIMQNEKGNTKESVNSAKLMMLKNLEKAGQVAFLQESKKGEQAPDFAQQTAPIYSKDTDEQITQSMQYLQTGGLAQKAFWDKINQNKIVYKPLYNFSALQSTADIKPTQTDSMVYKVNFEAMLNNEPYALRKRAIYEKYGIPMGDQAKGPTNMDIYNMDRSTQNAYEDAINQKSKVNLDMYLPATSKKPSYQAGGTERLTDEEIIKAEQNLLKDTKGWNKLYNHGLKTYYGKPGSIRKTPTAAQEAAYAKYLANETPEQKVKRQARETQQKIASQYGYTKDSIEAQLPRTPYGNPYGMQPVAPYQPKAPNFANLKTGRSPGNPNGLIDSTTYDSKLSLLQKFNIGLPFYRALNVKTQYPLRQHQESVIPQMDNINAQPQLDANNQAYFNSASLVNSMPASQGAAYAQQMFGQRIAANNQVIGNVQNANVQTQNNQKVGAAASLNNDAIANRGFDKYYYDATQTAIKNREELRQAYTDQGINTLNDTMSKKLNFDSFINSQQQYKGKPTYIDQDGVQHYEGQALYTPKAGLWGNTVQYNAPNIDWANYQRSTGNKIDSPEELGAAYQKLVEVMPGLTPDAFIKSRTLMNFNTNPSSVSPSFKKGGKMNLRPKKSLC
jgi:hypothetical protein